MPRMFSFVESFKFPDKDITRRSKVVSRAITKEGLNGGGSL